MKYVVVGGWAGVELFVTKDKFGHWELDHRPSAHLFTEDEAKQVAALIHGIVMSETYRGADEAH